MSRFAPSPSSVRSLLPTIVLALGSWHSARGAEEHPIWTAPLPPPAATAPATEPPKRVISEAQGLVTLGTSLTERGDFDAAEIAFRQVMNSAKAEIADVKAALIGLGNMHRRKGEGAKAAAIYERFLKDYPDDDRAPDVLLNLGRTLRGLGVYRLALTRFYSVINSTLKMPTDGFDRYQVLAKTAQFEIAETHFVAGEYAQAAKYFARLRLLDLAPADRARAHFKSGCALRLQGDREAAVAMLRSYVEQWPQDEDVPEARHLLAITLRELNRTQEAFAATLELLRTEKSRVATDPKRWAYWQRRTGNQLANDFFEAGDTLNARALYAGLLELSPEPVWRLPITYQIALCYERLGSSENARAAYQAILDAAGPSPAPEFHELVTMSKWRMEHLEWHDRMTRQISTFLDSTTGKAAATSMAHPASTKTAATP